MSIKPFRFLIAVFALYAGVISLAFAQTAPIPQRVVPYSLSSGEIGNAAGEAQVAFAEVVSIAGVPWMRLSLTGTVLADGSKLIITSLADGAQQNLNAETLAQWGSSSAYFNGDAVQVELLAAPGTDGNAVAVDAVIVGENEPGLLSQCGPTDDRVSSDKPERARLMNVGCTASIANTDSCFITAGHCLSSPSRVNVVEFNVPPSLPSGAVQHPGPEDQYAVTNERDYTNGGVGNDWGVFTVFPNSETGLTPYEAQGSHVTPTSDVPGTSDDVEIVGYGVDSGVDNQTQQIHSGPVYSVGGTTLRYRVDTEGGNSGSSVTYPDTLDVVAIHTHGGCSTSGSTSSNAGTLSTHPSFLAAYGQMCGTSTGIPCGDIRLLRGFCFSRGLLIFARMTDGSHDGDTLTVALDGDPRTMTINNGRAIALEFGFSGTGVIELTDPAGCFDPITVSCP